MPLTEGYCKGFDLDLEFGKMGEEFTQKVFEGNSKVEVKTERDMWKRTGNVAIELASRGKLSGLNTTKAEWWAQVLTIEGNIEGVLMFPVEKLKEIVKRSVKRGRGRMVMGGDSDTSELALIPLDEISMVM